MRRRGWKAVDPRLLTFQKGFSPAQGDLITMTVTTSVIMKAIESAIKNRSTPNLALIRIKSRTPQLYERLMVKTRKTVVKIHHGSRNSASQGLVLGNKFSPARPLLKAKFKYISMIQYGQTNATNPMYAILPRLPRNGFILIQLIMLWRLYEI